MSVNEIKQKVSLDIKEYSDNVKKANKELKSATDEMNKDLTNSSKVINQNEKQWKQWGKEVGDTLKKAGSNIKDNLSTGIKAATLGFGGEALNKAAKDAVAMAMDASETFAKIQARLGATTSQMDKWRESITKTSISTKTNLAQMTSAFDEMSQVANPEEVLKFMDAIGNATMMNGGNSKGVTDMLKNVIRGQGKEFTNANVNDVLNSANLLTNHGADMGSIDKAMGAMSGLDQNAVKLSGLSQKQIVGLLSGASQTGIHGIDAVQGMLGSNGQGMLSQLNGVLGGQLMQGGKLNLSALGSSQANGLTHLGKDENTNLAIFKQMSGLGDKEAEGMFNMIRQFEKMNRVMDETIKDQTTLGDSAKVAGNNLKASYQKLETTLVGGFADIFRGFEAPLSNLLSGNFGKAAGGLYGGTKNAIGSAVIDHPLLTLGALGTLAGGGKLISSLLGKKGVANTTELIKSVGIGSALKQMGVTPVYVVNASDMGKDQNMAMGALKDMMGGDITKTVAGKAGVFAGKGKFMGKAGLVGLAGMGVDYAGDKLTEHGHENWGRAANVGGEALEGAATGAMLGSIIPGIGTAIGAGVGATLGTAHGIYKVMVEVDSKDPQFSARPKSTDNARSARTY
jgi:hypothetical protein